MVSFQCEACGDVFTKKKLDPHRGQCASASFSCLDCMQHFNGTEYRAHTSCMTEAQKYQGNLYKEKPAKAQKRKSVTIAPDVIEHKPRAPYVEDAPDADDPKPRNGAGSPPPPAPSPPPATPALPAPTNNSVNVFDFQDPSDTPNGNHDHGQMAMIAHAPSVFDAPKQLTRFEDEGEDDEPDYDLPFHENGYSYGAGPIPPATLERNEVSNISMEFLTPAPKSKSRMDRTPRDQPPPSLEHSRTSSLTTTDKKRKRGQPREQSLDDTPMTDAPSSVLGNPSSTPALNHSGLTGGLTQMMRTMSPEENSDNEGYTHPPSPIKRTRRGNHNNKDNSHHAENGLGISVKGGGAGRKLMSLLGGATGVSMGNGSSNDPSSKALIRTRRRSSSDGGDDKARKALRKQKHRKDESSSKGRKRRVSGALVTTNGHHSDDSDDDQPRRLKAIEYKRRGDADDRSRSPQGTKSHHRSKNGIKDKNNQLVLYDSKHSDSDDPNGSAAVSKSLRHERADHFLSLVNKGPDSERGCSVHKALKRYHRDYSSPMGSEERDQRSGGGEKRGRARGRSGHRDRREDEERELWRMLRLKKNDRGEIVVFI